MATLVVAGDVGRLLGFGAVDRRVGLLAGLRLRRRRLLRPSPSAGRGRLLRRLALDYLGALGVLLGGRSALLRGLALGGRGSAGVVRRSGHHVPLPVLLSGALGRGRAALRGWRRRRLLAPSPSARPGPSPRRLALDDLGVLLGGRSALLRGLALGGRGSAGVLRRSGHHVPLPVLLSGALGLGRARSPRVEASPAAPRLALRGWRRRRLLALTSASGAVSCADSPSTTSVRSGSCSAGGAPCCADSPSEAVAAPVSCGVRDTMCHFPSS
ncbi:MAG: hypothetical protein WKF31_03580 [Thermoleophilaceae bacterium]